MSNDKIVGANGVDICVESFGDKSDPAILLIHGASASMLAWEDEFCTRLASGNRFVIRYDHRDTGRSVSYPTGRPPYSFRDMMEDAMGVLDAFEVERAHIVGRSMGGGMAILAALDHPERVLSLTLMATSPGGGNLAPPSDQFLAQMRSNRPPEWSDRNSVIDYIVALLRTFDGGTAGFDEAATRDLVTRDVERTVNIASSQTNHFLIAESEPMRRRLGEIRAPTLVIHGAKDPVFPLDHGEALANEIPGARLLVLPESGHLILSQSWDSVVPAMLSHTKGSP